MNLAALHEYDGWGNVMTGAQKTARGRLIRILHQGVQWEARYCCPKLGDGRAQKALHDPAAVICTAT
jgi:hypothetical protein